MYLLRQSVDIDITNFPLIEGYKITSFIYHGEHTKIFRGFRLNDQLPIILKLRSSDYPTSDELYSLQREYQIGKQIKGKYSVKYLEILPYKSGKLIVLEDSNSVNFKEALQAKNFSLNDFFYIAIQLIEGLEEIHNAGIRHGNINPKNIIYQPEFNSIKYIDFSIASFYCEQDVILYEDTIPLFDNNEQLIGELEYIAPEQTRRLGRSIDERADYYSLGIIFYQMLTKQLPFNSNEAINLIYQHIASQPIPPHELNQTIPKVLSKIALKLISKNPEERYQTLRGLRFDLEKCRDYFLNNHNLLEFNLAENDFSTSFKISQKMYGRKEEVEILQAAFNRIILSKTEVVLISGDSGVGKSMLVEEVQKNVILHKGYFLFGKFAQLNRNVAYSAIVQAFQGLIHQILAESDQQISKWNVALSEALGANGQIIIDIIPELELLIGKQLNVQPLGMTETHNRFNYVFQRFISVFAKQPIILLLDDLQWADLASLKLIEFLITTAPNNCLLFVASYRDNEIGAAHPAQLVINAIENAHIPLQHIKLKPLAKIFIRQWVVESFYWDLANTDLEQLTELLYEKTNGNPFFIKEFLNFLYDEGYISFIQNITWVINWSKIEQSQVMSNVANLMKDRISKLSKEIQDFLIITAYLGVSFDLQILEIVLESNTSQVIQILTKALQTKMILPLGSKYHFAHDAIQEAAYALLPIEKRGDLHFKIGMLLLKAIPKIEANNKIFDIVEHLNRGAEYSLETNQNLLRAKLNLLAGEKAKHLIAYVQALKYFKICKELLEKTTSWNESYKLFYRVFFEYIEVAYLNKQFDEADQLCKLLFNHAKTKLEKVDTLRLQLSHYLVMGKHQEAIDVGLKALALLEVKIPLKSSKLTILKELLITKFRLRNKNVTSLLNHQEMQDLNRIMSMRILVELTLPAYNTGQQSLLILLILKQINLSLKYGNITESAFSYVMYGMLLSTTPDKLQKGYEFGNLGVELNKRYNDLRLRPRILYLYIIFIYSWRNHWKDTVSYLEQAIELGYQMGDFVANSCMRLETLARDSDMNLSAVIKQSEKYFQIVKETKFQNIILCAKVLIQLLCNFHGKTNDLLSISDNQFDELVANKLMLEKKYYTGPALYYLSKLQICFFYEQYDEALNYIEKIDPFKKAISGVTYEVEFYFFSALTFIAYYKFFTKNEKGRAWRKIQLALNKIIIWSSYSAINFMHFQLILQAEIKKILQQYNDALSLYDEAILVTQKHGYLRYEALSNELAAKCFMTQNKNKLARSYMSDAVYLYKLWHAYPKVTELEKKYGFILQQANVNSVSTKPVTLKDVENRLDALSIIQAIQAISSEVNFNNLLTALINIIIEYAGAHYCVLMLEVNNKLYVNAYGVSDKNQIQISIPKNLLVEDAKKQVPLDIVNYVKHAMLPVVISNATQDHRFKDSLYIKENITKSILCFPIIRQKLLFGILYLENNLTISAFTEERQLVLNILAVQAAISLENALLYQKEKKAEEKSRVHQQQLAHSTRLATAGELISSIAHEINQPLTAIASYSAGCVNNLQKINAPAEIIDVVKSMGTQAKRTGDIINHLKNFLRKGTLEKTPVEVNGLITELVKLIEFKSKEADVIIKLVLDSTESLQIFADKVQIEQVIFNLANNAIEAMQDTDNFDRLLQIQTVFKPEDNEIEIHISDTGTGVPDDVLEHIFHPFFTTKAKGMGIGLSLSKSLIEAHDGTITLSNKPDKGCNFCITLPRA